MQTHIDVQLTNRKLPTVVVGTIVFWNRVSGYAFLLVTD